MPTICDIKMELKALGIKGLTGKKKDELMFMLSYARNPVPKVLPKKRQKVPAPAPKPSKGERFASLANIFGFEPVGQYLDDEREAVSLISPEMTKKVRNLQPLPLSPQDRLWDEITSLVEEAKSKAREGASYKTLAQFWNKEISPKLDLYGGEYLDYGGASELADELFGDIEEEHRIYNEKKEEEQPNKKPSPPPIIPKLIKKQMLDILKKEDYETHKYKRGLAYPIYDMIDRLKKIQSNEEYWGNYQTEKAKLAFNFIYDLRDWVGNNSYKAEGYPFGNHDRKEYILLNDDWKAFLKANK